MFLLSINPFFYIPTRIREVFTSLTSYLWFLSIKIHNNVIKPLNDIIVLDLYGFLRWGPKTLCSLSIKIHNNVVKPLNDIIVLDLYGFLYGQPNDVWFLSIKIHNNVVMGFFYILFLKLMDFHTEDLSNYMDFHTEDLKMKRRYI